MPTSLHNTAHQIIARTHAPHGSAVSRLGAGNAARLASGALAGLLTLATLAGVDGLAVSDTAAPQLAQAGSPAGRMPATARALHRIPARTIHS